MILERNENDLYEESSSAETQKIKETHKVLDSSNIVSSKESDKKIIAETLSLFEVLRKDVILKGQEVEVYLMISDKQSEYEFEHDKMLLVSRTTISYNESEC